MDPVTDILAATRATFFGECEEGLQALEDGLSALGDGSADGEVVHAVFRAVHSIKGGAGAFGLTALVRFAHGFETVLDALRSGALAVGGDLVRTLLSAADVLADLVVAARDGGSVEAGRVAAADAALTACMPPGEPVGASDAGTDDFGFRPTPVAFAPIGAPMVADRAVTVRFRPHGALYARGNEAAHILRELARTGSLAVTLDDSALRPLDAFDAEDPRLGWTLRVTGAGEAAVREAFEWVEGDCDLAVEAAGVAAVPSVGRPVDSSGADDVSAILARLMAEAAPPPAAAPPPQVTPEAVAEAAPVAVPEEAPRAAPAEQAPTIRVDLDRVDRLIDLAGELVIHQAVLAQRAMQGGLGRGGVLDGLEDLERLTRDLQDSVMAIRAQPVRAVLQRMPRLVREVAARTGKRVRLVTEGEATEVDRTVIERLGEPLTHMIRNAVDHGLEAPEARVAAGKPREGVLRVSASHRSGRIVIEVSDDGAGINRERVRARAEERGLVVPGTALTDDEVDNLIFLPGFSTVETVSDISGRGVGMDVVRRSVLSLGGRIAITSRPGEGSTFTLSLPLTLAVLDGMVIEAAGQTLVLPLSAILETLQPRTEDLRRLGTDVPLLVSRGAFVPIVDIGHALGYRPDPITPTDGVILLVEGEGGRRFALLVDAIQGGRQVVIKSLEANYRAVPGISAATILGDGRVALIVDADALASVRGPPVLPSHEPWRVTEEA